MAYFSARFGIRSSYFDVAFESLAIGVHRRYVNSRREGDHELIASCGKCSFELDAECEHLIAAN